MESTSASDRSYPPASSSFSTGRNKFLGGNLRHGASRTSLSGLPSSPRDPRFSTTRPLMSPALSSPPLTPMTSNPFSPPMSAKSFGTFIDSEPSTPAYSPRPDCSDWDSNPLILLSPVPSEHASPLEPSWDMAVPLHKPKTSSLHSRALSKPKHSRSISMSSVQESHSSQRSKSVPTEPLKENQAPIDGEKPEGDEEASVRTEQSSHITSLGGLKTKMKSMLRRKTVGDKESEKIEKKKAEKRRRGYEDFDRMEYVHWTEM